MESTKSQGFVCFGSPHRRQMRMQARQRLKERCLVWLNLPSFPEAEKSRFLCSTSWFSNESLFHNKKKKCSVSLTEISERKSVPRAARLGLWCDVIASWLGAESETDNISDSNPAKTQIGTWTHEFFVFVCFFFRIPHLVSGLTEAQVLCVPA